MNRYEGVKAFMNDIVEEAKEKGYDLEVEDLTIYNEQPSKFVKLEYCVMIPVFELFGDKFNKQGVIEGYAR